VVFPLLGSGYGVETTVARDPPQRCPRSWPQRRSISVPFFFWMCGWVMKVPGRRKFSLLLRGLDVASKVPPRRGSCGLGSHLYSTKQRNLKVRILKGRPQNFSLACGYLHLRSGLKVESVPGASVRAPRGSDSADDPSEPFSSTSRTARVGVPQRLTGFNSVTSAPRPSLRMRDRAWPVKRATAKQARVRGQRLPDCVCSASNPPPNRPGRRSSRRSIS